MKSRSHRLPVSEPHHDDWVDGSWTVDCVCGVNFDDGEEMVDCDECGVWVHTRCARYVKSEKSFSCDKCKSKNSSSGGGGLRNDSEETEVAEFLVELPTKTLRMDNPNTASVSSRRPFRLWTNIPMEERVHVQGVPGGEPALFSGTKMSPIFGPELWKCTGYVPKKFDFSYTEFPCFGRGKVVEKKEEEMDKTNGEENANQADNGVAVLFSLSKENENILPTPAVDSVGVRRPIEGGGCSDLVSPRQKKSDGENLNFACPVNSIKESSSIPIALHSGKRKKDELGMLKDQNVKKKVRTVDKNGDAKKRAGHASKAASTFSSDAKNVVFSQDRTSKTAHDDIRCSNDLLDDQLLDRLGECAANLASNECGPMATFGNDVSSGEMSRDGNKGDQVPVGSENSSKTNSGVKSFAEPNGALSKPVKEEGTGDTVQSCGDVGGGAGSVEIGSVDKEPVAMDVRIADPDSKESQHGHDSDIDEANSRPNKKLKSDLDADDHGRHYVESLPLNDVKFETMKATAQNPELSVNVLSEESKAIDTLVVSSEASDPKVLDSSRSLTVSCRTDKADESPGNPYQSKQEAGSEGSGARKRSSGSKHNSEVADELLKSNDAARSHSTAAYQRKTVVSVVKSSSTSRGIMPKSSDNRATAAAQDSSNHSRQKELSESTVATMKDNALADTVDHDEKCGRPKKLVRESSRSNSLSKVPESTKLSHTSDSKRLSSDSKDSSIHSSSKVPLVPNMASNLVSGEGASPPPTEIASNVQNKTAPSAAPGKVEKFSHSGSHLSSKGNVGSMTAQASSNVPATLSDEELALLLHQELNSSPRVPRVPRMRNAGSLPQLTCPMATSMLMKRTSSVGGKDHGLASRRRTKDFPGDSSHGSLEVDNEAKKMDRKPSSPDNRRRDSGCSSDLLSRREADSGPVKSVQSMKKNVSSSLSSSDANGHNLSSSRSSSRNASDDDPRIAGRLANRTLPGLIAEIMSEGKRMTYEELCNAVLPHWPHLRKHNGERYAYSSHSQAVLDCLRNRSEWARLVDRGPKTNASRKRRKLDADSMSIDSEDNEENRVKNTKDVGGKSFESHQEDFPKGKRKARKRRRLALQGRGIVRRRRRADVVSDDESESFSNSSEDTMSSEEEIQGGDGTSIAGSEASASSDEVR